MIRSRVFQYVSFLIVAVLVTFAGAQRATTKTLTGKVLNQRDAPVPGAVVYLTNTRTRAIRTYIVRDDGAFHFPALAANTDFELYAQRGDKKSDTKTVSQFDDRPQVNINLKLDTP